MYSWPWTFIFDSEINCLVLRVRTAVFEVGNESERISKSCGRGKGRGQALDMTVSIGVVSNSVQIGMKTLDGSEEVCVLRYHQGAGKKEEVKMYFQRAWRKNVCRGQERVKRKRRTDGKQRNNWLLEMIISGQGLKMRASKMADWE